MSLCLSVCECVSVSVCKCMERPGTIKIQGGLWGPPASKGFSGGVEGCFFRPEASILGMCVCVCQGRGFGEEVTT